MRGTFQHNYTFSDKSIRIDPAVIKRAFFLYNQKLKWLIEEEM